MRRMLTRQAAGSKASVDVDESDGGAWRADPWNPRNLTAPGAATRQPLRRPRAFLPALAWAGPAALAPLGGGATDAGTLPMIRTRRQDATIAAGCGDVSAIVLALWFAYLLRGPGNSDHYVLAGVVATLLYLLATSAARGGRGSSHTLAGEFRRVLSAWAWTLVGLLAIGWLTKLTGHYSRVAVGLWAAGTALGLIAWRLALSFAKRSPRGAPAVIAGIGGGAKRFALHLQSDPLFQSPLAGFYADACANGAREELPAPLLGDLDALVERAAQGEDCAVFIALPLTEEDTIRRLVAALSDTTVDTYVVPNSLAGELEHSRWVSVGSQPVISVLESPFFGVNGWVKRAEDVVLALVALAVAAVPMLLIGALLRLTSAGPVLFRQRRHGIDGRMISVLKFRTMTVAQDGDDVPQAVAEDPRLTAVGAFLRRTSLDELPQFLNVLRGEMSVVGPRPHALAHNEYYRRLIPGYMLRAKVKPGITGWAQIHGLRGRTDTIENMERRIRYDLWYVDRWSVWLDLWIVARSVPMLAGDRNAV